MSDNSEIPAASQVSDITKNTAGLSLSVKAKEFRPTFNAKAPAFVPRALGPKPAAATPAPAAAPAAAAPKAMSISIGGAAPAPAPAPAAAAAAAAAPVTVPTPTPAATPVSAPAPAALEPIVETLEVDDDVLLDEHFKEHINVIFMGHVDAGKSTLGGNILFLTDMVDKRTMEKYEREAKECGRESWYLSWALDTNQEERAKGKTVECGRAFFETSKRRYTILDAPGHKNFVPSMLGGASQADCGVLVISARKGEFETGFDRGGQTQEHAYLAKAAGVRCLIVAINKMDDPTVNWSKERYDEIIAKLLPFLKRAGYPKADLIFLPISGYTGAGVKDRVAPANCPWYSGPSLLEHLDGLQTIERKINGPLRIAISEKYKDMGTIVSGKVDSGHIKVNQKVVIMPDKRVCEISTIYGENESEVQTAICGDNVRIKLRGIDEDAVQPGYVITDTKHPCHSTRAFEAQISILDARNIITAGYKSVLHVHSAIEEVTITKLLHKLKKGLKSKVPPAFVKTNESCIVRIETNRAICLGRFTLRDEGNTIAIGKILRVAKPSSGTASTNAAATAAATAVAE
ncbi:P-loop containing nucleoside triphosphate hydrolase protein [Kickxella alabastrina]|uniref:P-loop containing nucleoside triphosphate hydrolase protein n=1 Tax=Kickxella alabastrina TaxID=61397 RepID=UPI00221EF01F|nr:P-loop containing nucleoside triphosphate hydrolase protein [Kickxella alabastrina]KAI7824177.1 P-loop containing nucleoside triphosphate hydrolase protein [Kickxella alabastrina]